TVAPTSPVPVMVGLGATTAAATGVEITGTAGAIVSFEVVPLAVPVPVTLVCDALTAIIAPSAKPETFRLTVKAPAVQAGLPFTVPTATETVPAAVVQVPDTV